jgi:iron(II)-dependent oxidoreductase
MNRSQFSIFDFLLGAGILLVSLGGFLHDYLLFGGGLAVIGFVAVRKRGSGRRLEPVVSTRPRPLGDASSQTARPAPPRANPLADVHDTSDLVETMIRDGRYALLLRPQIIGNLNEQQVARVLEQLEGSMVLVPSGPVCVGLQSGELLEDGEAEFVSRGPDIAGRLVMVDPLFLDRYCVSNADYQRFLDAGGYEQMALWDEEALPALLDFVDHTGEPGPRYWSGGAYPKGEARLPVVGVSWYEATAYARWCGKRLPTDAEWIRAGAWPVESSPGHLVHRRYPWGNAFDGRRANIWGAGHEGPVAVDEFRHGMSVGGNHQLIGNVWEWTSCDFGDPEDYTLRLPLPMRSLRGGAYDTYFENQATCHFQSGDSPLARKHNIGFRLALGTCDVAPEIGLMPAEADEPAAVAV